MSTEYYLPYSKETYENFNLLIWILVNQRIFWFLIVQTHSVDYVTAAVFFLYVKPIFELQQRFSTLLQLCRKLTIILKIEYRKTPINAKNDFSLTITKQKQLLDGLQITHFIFVNFWIQSVCSCNKINLMLNHHDNMSFKLLLLYNVTQKKRLFY